MRPAARFRGEIWPLADLAGHLLCGGQRAVATTSRPRQDSAMRPLPRCLALAAWALTLTACASTMNVSSHVDRGVNFARYQTFDWGPADALPTGDSRLDANPFFKDHLQGEVEKQLTARGFTIAGRGSGTPDLLIHYHANISERIDVAGVDRDYGYGGTARSYEAGTIVLDVVDARTQQVIWRGWAQEAVAGMLASDDVMAGKIEEAVTRMLARLPARR